MQFCYQNALLTSKRNYGSLLSFFVSLRSFLQFKMSIAVSFCFSVYDCDTSTRLGSREHYRFLNQITFTISRCKSSSRFDLAYCLFNLIELTQLQLTYQNRNILVECIRKCTNGFQFSDSSCRFAFRLHECISIHMIGFQIHLFITTFWFWRQWHFIVRKGLTSRPFIFS